MKYPEMQAKADGINSCATGPWQTGEPDEQWTYLVHLHNGEEVRGPSVAVWYFQEEGWLLWQPTAPALPPLPEGWTVLRYARINSPEETA